MLETGALPAILRGELEAQDGTPMGFDFALLPPADVARIVDLGGNGFRHEWVYAHGNAKAVSTAARSGSVRVLWEPSLFPDLILRALDASRGGGGVPPDAGPAPSQAKGTQPALTYAQKAKVVELYNHGRGVSVYKLAPMFNTSRRTIDAALGDAGVKKVTRRKERSLDAKTACKPN